jgi:hypothetical protein
MPTAASPGRAAVRVHAADSIIQDKAGRDVKHCLVEMPKSQPERPKLFKIGPEVARSGGFAGVPDEGESYLSLHKFNVAPTRALLSLLHLWRRLPPVPCLSDFKNDRQNQRSLRSLLVEKAFQVDADLFFDHSPVGLFFGRRLFDGANDHLARLVHDLVAVVAR